MTTCFNMRHKLYKAASKIQRNTVLHGEVELDPTYTSINLKGTKREKNAAFQQTQRKKSFNESFQSGEKASQDKSS